MINKLKVFVIASLLSLKKISILSSFNKLSIVESDISLNCIILK